MPAADDRISIGWQIAQVFGLAAVAGCLLLLLITVRRRVSPAYAPVLPLRRHELIGWSVLIATALHVLILLVVDQRVIEHLKLTAPLYEWAGIVALVLLIVLTPLSSTRLRQLMWSNHRGFQALHVGLSCVLIPALAIHVTVASHFVHGMLRMVAFLAVSAAALLGLLRVRTRPLLPASSLARGHLVFARHSRKIALLAAVASAATVALLSARAAVELREPLVARSTALKVNFPHDKHREVNCVECHHNFTDKTGSGSCYACHRSGRADLRLGAEARFHDFCLGCHRDPRPTLMRHGPVMGCSTCHAP